MIGFFLFSLSINFFRGFKWYEYEKPPYYFGTIEHNRYDIEIVLPNFSVQSGIENMKIDASELGFLPCVSSLYQSIISIGIKKGLKYKWSQFELGANTGYFGYSYRFYPGIEHLISFLFIPSFHIKIEIPKTNLLLALFTFYSQPFIYFKHNPPLTTPFALFFEIGFKVKE